MRKIMMFILYTYSCLIATNYTRDQSLINPPDQILGKVIEGLASKDIKSIKPSNSDANERLKKIRLDEAIKDLRQISIETEQIQDFFRKYEQGIAAYEAMEVVFLENNDRAINIMKKINTQNQNAYRQIISRIYMRDHDTGIALLIELEDNLYPETICDLMKYFIKSSPEKIDNLLELFIMLEQSLRQRKPSVR